MATIGNSLAPYFTATTSDVFSANGTGTTFTLTRSISNLVDIEVLVNNIQQNPFNGAYSVNGTTLTFSEAPSVGANNVLVSYRQAIIGSSIPTPNTVSSISLQRDLTLGGNTTSNGTMFTQALVPTANVTYDIGTSTLRYKDIYLSGTTIKLGDVSLSASGNTFTVANSTGGTLPSSMGNTTIVGTANVTGDMTIGGNLTVTGTMTYINTTDLNIGDAIISLNADLAANIAPTEDAGININRGASTNAQFKWIESTDNWSLGNTTVSGILNANDTIITGTANVSVGINVGANVNLGTTYMDVGNSTVNTTITNITVSTNTVNVASIINVGANVNLSTSQISVGNSTVNTNISFTTLTVQGGNSTVNAVALVGIDSNTYGRIEIGGTSGGYLDFKSPVADDYDTRISSNNSGFYINARSSTFSNNVTIFADSTFINTSSFSIANNTANNLTVVANGNVGVGTTTPLHKLDVRGTVLAIPAAVDQFGFQMFKTGTSTTIAGFYQDTTNNGLLALYNTSAQLSVSLSGAAANALTLAANGNLGIGTTTPGYKLDVTGTAHVSSHAYLDSLVSGYIPHTGVTGWGATVGGAQSIAKLKWGSYGRIQHTSYGNIPFLSFNAELYESDYSGSGSGQSSRNYFRPDYNLGQYAILSHGNGGVAFNVGYWSSNNSIDLGAIGDHASYVGGVLPNGNWEFKKNIAVGGATPTTSGSGITFPAVQSASTNANTLDDYEEGTFSTSMNLKFGGANVGMTYGSRSAQYVKIGKMVLINLYLYLSAKGSSTGQASIEGFPFGTGTSVDFFIPLGVRGNLNTGGNQVSLYSSGGGATTFPLYQCNLTGGSNAILSDSAFNNNTELNFNFWYYTDS